MKVIIMRGIPGAGKSTYVLTQYPSAVVCSADHYFVDPKTGEYNYIACDIGRAHDACKRKFEDALWMWQPLIVVDNTNTRLWEFSSYVDAAKLAGYEVEVIRLDVDPKVAADRCVHGVPGDQIQIMQNRFEDYEGEVRVC